MQTLRTAKAAADYFRERDPDSTLTEYTIRKWMDDGELPFIQVGKKRITSIEAIMNHIDQKLRTTGHE